MPKPDQRPAIIRFYHLIAKCWRRKRFARFERWIAPQNHESLVDLGGYPFNWYGKADVIGHVDVVNLGICESEDPPAGSPPIRAINGDARNLHFADGQFDIVFSNSVIEHVGSFDDQQAFATEARRVGTRLWIQTPAYECPIEPHFLGLFLHWLPSRFQASLARIFSIRGLTGAASPAELLEIARSTRLLTRHEMVRLFPDCQIWTERLLWVIPKSHVAVRGVRKSDP
jgi:hypothetical protein